MEGQSNQKVRKVYLGVGHILRNQYFAIFYPASVITAKRNHGQTPLFLTSL